MTEQEQREAEFNAGFNDVRHGLTGCMSGAYTLAYIHIVRTSSERTLKVCTNEVKAEYVRGSLECINVALQTGMIPPPREVKKEVI